MQCQMCLEVCAVPLFGLFVESDINSKLILTLVFLLLFCVLTLRSLICCVLFILFASVVSDKEKYDEAL